MQRIALNAESRDATGKGVARKLRAVGQIPAILYGEAKPPQPLAMDRRALALTLQGAEGYHLLVDLSVGGSHSEETLAVLQDLSVDPVSQTILHADFRRVDAKKPIRTNIPIHVTGIAVGVKIGGGIHQQVLRELEVEALPSDVPEHVEIDITHLGIGDSIHVSDLVGDERPYTILTESDRVISSILAPKLVEEEVKPEEEAVEGEEVTAEGEEKAEEGEEKSEKS